MPLLTDAQLPPRLPHVLGQSDQRDGLRVAQRAPCRLKLVAAPRDLTTEQVDPEIPGARGRQEHRELLFRVPDSLAQPLRLVALPARVPQMTERLHRDPFDVLIEEPDRHRGRVLALAPGVPPRAHVRGRSTGVPAARAGHHVPAPRAPDEPREERPPSGQAASGPRLRALRSLEHVDVDDRRVRRGVDVRSDPQLTEVHAVGDQVPGAGRRHREQVGDLDERGADRSPGERLTHDLGRGLVDDQPPGARVTLVAGRGLPALPDPRGGRPLAQQLELLGVPLALGDVDGLLHVAHHAARDRPGVELLADRDHASTGGFDALPQLVAAPARQAGQVRADHAGVDAGLDALDRGPQARPVVNRAAAGHVELDWQHHDVDAEARGLGPNDLLLLTGGVEAVGCRVTPVQAADADDSSEREAYMVHDGHDALAVRGRLSPIPDLARGSVAA